MLALRYDMELVVPDDQKNISPIERLHRREQEATDRFTVGSKGPTVRFRSAAAVSHVRKDSAMGF